MVGRDANCQTTDVVQPRASRAVWSDRPDARRQPLHALRARRKKQQSMRRVGVAGWHPMRGVAVAMVAACIA